MAYRASCPEWVESGHFRLYLAVVKSMLRPDRFAIGLFLSGVVMFFLPLMLMPGLVAMLSALAYWLTMMVLRAAKHPRI
jgi:hypothetical protein